MSELLPCPFCRSTNLRRAEMYYDDDGEHEGIECLDCDANARADRWNQRPVCEWKEHPEDGYWQSACGEQWCFVDGGVEDNRVRFCHGCGGKVVSQ